MSNKKNNIKILLMGGIAMTIIVLGIMCYLPFVQLKNIDVVENLGCHLDAFTHDKILGFKTRIQLYPYCWFIHKGDSYTDIPLLDLDSVSYRRSIKINWDNSITISDDSFKYVLHVRKVVISPQLFPFSDDDYPYKLHETEDSLFSVVAMYDEKNNEIDIYRQKESMPYKGKRVGFRLKINGKVLVTGTKEMFDY